MRHYDLDGKSLDLNSIFIGVQRAYLPSQGDLMNAMTHRSDIAMPVKFIGRWETFAATIREIRVLHDGLLVITSPVKNSLLQNWRRAMLWMPNNGMAGIINYA
jgi:hypothetical protein